MFPGEPTGQLRSSTTGRGLSTDSGGEAPSPSGHDKHSLGFQGWFFMGFICFILKMG